MLNKLPWNESKIWDTLTNRHKGAKLILLFSNGLSFIIIRLSLISHKKLSLSWAKMLKLSKEGK